MKNVINKIRTAIALMIHGEITHYDANGKLTYTKDSNGTEWWFEYYSNGTLKHSKSSIGREWVYDANGKLIHTKDVNGYKQFFEYDANGHLIQLKLDSYGFDIRYDYDAHGCMIHLKRMNVVKSGMNTIEMTTLFIRYVRTDSKNGMTNGKPIHEGSYGSEEWYDPNGNIIHLKCSNGLEYW